MLRGMTRAFLFAFFGSSKFARSGHISGRRLWIGVMAWLAAGAELPAADSPLRVLIFSGQNNHEWQQTTPKLCSVLTNSGRFEVEVTDRPEQCDAPKLARFDAILSNWNTFGNPAVTNWPEATRRAFLEFLRKGKGFVIVHAGGSSFYDWPEYQQAALAYWTLGQTSHGSPHEFAVRFGADHPITRGLESFRTTDELWLRVGVDAHAQVLATGDDQPLAFVGRFGQGRSFALLLGHSAGFMDTPGFQTLLARGTEWAASGEVTAPANLGEQMARRSALQALLSYRFGDNRAAVLALERLVAAAAPDAQQRKALAGQLTDFLAGPATVDGKRVACRQLALIASAAEVPVLARALQDPGLAYEARLALERVPGPEAEQALVAALQQVPAELRPGILDSLGVRGSRSVVPEIAPSLASSEPATVAAALQAFGQIGGDAALKALVQSETRIPPALRLTLGSALLQAAARTLVRESSAEAMQVLEHLETPGTPDQVRSAAFALRLRGLGDRADDTLLKALFGTDEAMQTGAVEALRQGNYSTLAQPIAEHLDQVPARRQVQLLVWLGELAQPATLPALVRAASSPTPEVRLAAIRALGLTGDASTIPLLSRLGATGGDEEKRLSAEALARLRGDNIDSALVASLKTSPPTEQSGLVQCLVLRSVATAVPALIDLARASQDPVRSTAISAVGKLGNPDACTELAPLLDQSPEQAASAMAEICRRQNSVQPLLVALSKARGAGKGALLEVLGSFGGPAALAAVRAELKSNDPDVRAAATRSLANWPDAAPLDELAALAAASDDVKCKTLALRGVARLAPMAKDRAPETVVALVIAAMKVGANPNEQRMLLAALAEIPGPASLNAVEAYVGDPMLGVEAKAAVERLKTGRTPPAAPPWNDAIVQLFTSPENLCRGATATNLDGLVPDGQGQGPWAAIDGNPETYWDETDNRDLYRLRVQLPKRSRVACLRLLGWQPHNFAPRDFEILCDDRVIRKVQNAEYLDNLLTVDLPPTECGAVELKITGYYGQSPAIREMGLYSKSSGVR
jgi:uncharacterized protein